MNFDIPATLAASTTDNLTAQLADTGTLSVIALAVLVPLAFYVARRVIGLFPKGK